MNYITLTTLNDFPTSRRFPAIVFYEGLQVFQDLDKKDVDFGWFWFLTGRFEHSPLPNIFGVKIKRIFVSAKGRLCRQKSRKTTSSGNPAIHFPSISGSTEFTSLRSKRFKCKQLAAVLDQVFFRGVGSAGGLPQVDKFAKFFAHKENVARGRMKRSCFFGRENVSESKM